MNAIGRNAKYMLEMIHIDGLGYIHLDLELCVWVYMDGRRIEKKIAGW